ncbi:unnamed protein product [Diamesa serratosioi]
MTENERLKTCRGCAKEEYIFCDTEHESICKILDFIPSLIDLNEDLQLDICINCYRMMKNMLFNIESIRDAQEILKIKKGEKSNLASSPAQRKRKPEIEDMLKKYTNLKIKKVKIENDNDQRTKINDSQKVIIIEPEDDLITFIEEIAEPVCTLPTKCSNLQCISCKNVFNSMKILSDHLKTCTPPKQNKSLRLLSDYRTKTALQEQIPTQALKTKQFICKMCNIIFHNALSLQNHCGKAHRDSVAVKKDHRCRHCNSFFLKIEHLKEHMKCHGNLPCK